MTEQPKPATSVTITISGRTVTVQAQVWADRMVARLQYAEHQRDRARELACALWVSADQATRAVIVDTLAGDFPTWLPDLRES